MYVCMYVCIYLNVCICACVYIRKHIRTTCIYIIHACVYMHMCRYIFYIHIYIYMSSDALRGFSTGSAGGSVFPLPAEGGAGPAAAGAAQEPPRDSGYRSAWSMESLPATTSPPAPAQALASTANFDATLPASLLAEAPPLAPGFILAPPLAPSSIPAQIMPATAPGSMPAQMMASGPAHVDATLAAMQEVAAGPVASVPSSWQAMALPAPASASVPNVLSQPLLAETQDLAKRQLDAAFDEVAFERDMERQLEMDYYEEQLQERKRAFEQEMQRMDEEAKQRKLSHDTYMKVMEDQERQAEKQLAKTMVQESAAGVGAWNESYIRWSLCAFVQE